MTVPADPRIYHITHIDNLPSIIEGHFVFGNADGDDRPTKELSLVPGAARVAEDLLATDEATQERLRRVSRLVEGFERRRSASSSPRGIGRAFDRIRSEGWLES